jgi:hypothetical protein
MLMRRLFGSVAGNLQWPVLNILSGLFALVSPAMRLPGDLLFGPMLGRYWLRSSARVRATHIAISSSRRR